MESPEAQTQATQASTDSTPGSAPSATAKELTFTRELGELRSELEAMTRQRDILVRGDDAPT